MTGQGSLHHSVQRQPKSRQSRGAPLMALGLILGSWVLVRAAMWQSPLAAVPQADATPSDALSAPERAPEQFRQPPERGAPQWDQLPMRPGIERPVLSRVRDWHVSDLNANPWIVAAAEDGSRNAVGHSMLLAAGLSQIALPSMLYARAAGEADLRPALGPRFAPRSAARFVRERAPARWSMDGWALLRQDTSSPLAAGQPSYGRSQIGAVLRYRLDPASRHAPQAHLRASAAITGAREREVALGLSARPFPHIPVRVAGEARLRDADTSELRASAYAVSELAPLSLPGGTSAEAYVQAGYVTGAAATGFVDGQARLTREFATGDEYRLQLGAGAWGGAQEGAGRLDLGPSAAVSFRLGEGNARLAADYRFRVAGIAAPDSGPTITLSAGF